MSDARAEGDRINRGDKSSSKLGSTSFVGFRALDPFLQYSILFHGTGSRILKFFGSDTFAMGPAANTGVSMIDSLQLSPYRLALFGMAVTSSVKHIFWKLFIGEENMDITTGAAVGVFNTVFNSANTLLAICQATSIAYGNGEGPNWSGWPMPALTVGSALFSAGIIIETVSEVQRKAFKSKAENAGKPYTGGLWSLSRHINYFGYTLWRAGFALAAGGWAWGTVIGGFFLWDFSQRVSCYVTWIGQDTDSHNPGLQNAGRVHGEPLC
jgi:protein-S-isoprenylcysteine O-methyltransferase Ste14